MTTTYNSMPSRSTLELMLEKIQQLENEAEDNGSPPPLPARPVSRARLPSQARRGIQQSPKLKKANSAFMIEAVVNSAQESIQINGLGDTSTKQAKIQGVLILQRCYRGHQARCYVNELKSSVITLQSFIRAEMSRKAYHHLSERLSSSNTEVQRCNVQDAQSNLLQGKNAAIIVLQSGIRGWLTRRSCKNIERDNIVPVEKSPAQKTIKPDSKEHIKIPYSIVFELQRQVLKTEAALQERKDQNAALMKNIKQYEERWIEYEGKMKSMEKMWQEQLTSMQASLADAAKKAAAKRSMAKSAELLQVESPLNMADNSAPHMINLQNAELDDNDGGNYFQVKLGCRISKKDVLVEFQKLESEFSAFEKEYSTVLEETKATMKKISALPKEKNQKRWWRRPLRG